MPANLENKKILFISVRFFGYENAILQRLQALGATVDFYDDRPSNSVFTKGIIRVRRGILQYRIQRYYKAIFEEIKAKKYDYFLMVKGEAIPEFFLELLRRHFPSMKRIAYTFDSLEEFPRFGKLALYFDIVFSFEKEDAQRFGMNFRPLFYLDDYLAASQSPQPKYSVAFVGSAHTDRFLVGEKVRGNVEASGGTSYFYYFAPSRTAFRLKKIFDKRLRKFDFKLLNYRSLSHVDITRIYQESRAVLDINKPHQNGITIRSFEVLASGRKLITTNSKIAEYPFYRAENILIICRENPIVPPVFLGIPSVPLDFETLYMMSLDSWIECLFIKHQDDYWI